MKTTRYAVIDRNDTKVNDHEKYEDAVQEAKGDGNCAVTEEQYEYTDSTVVWTPDGSNTWPPTGEGEED